VTALLYGPSALSVHSQENTGQTSDGTRQVFSFETTPSVPGVTRPNSYTITLAEGRDYILIGAVFVDRTATTDIYLDFQWFDVGASAYVGQKASLVSGSANSPSQGSRKNPMRRSSAVLYVPSSSITGTASFRLVETAVTSASRSYTPSPTNFAFGLPCLTIMSVEV
jgi:hypothetical protein